MKRFVTVLLACAAVVITATGAAQFANTVHRLAWDPNPPDERVVFYRVYVSTNGIDVRTNVVTGTIVGLDSVMSGLKNGDYSLAVTAVGLSGLESDRSASLVVDWYGNKPKWVSSVRVEQK